MGLKGSSCLFLFWDEGGASDKRSQIIAVSLQQAEASWMTPTQCIIKLKGQMCRWIGDFKSEVPDGYDMQRYRQHAQELRKRIYELRKFL